jgi:hypothetical protein
MALRLPSLSTKVALWCQWQILEGAQLFSSQHPAGLEYPESKIDHKNTIRLRLVLTLNTSEGETL